MMCKSPDVPLQDELLTRIVFINFVFLQLFEVKTETDSNDVVGIHIEAAMSGVYDAVFSTFVCLCVCVTLHLLL